MRSEASMGHHRRDGKLFAGGLETGLHRTSELARGYLLYHFESTSGEERDIDDAVACKMRYVSFYPLNERFWSGTAPVLGRASFRQ